MSEERTTLSSGRVAAGKNSYFIDAKQAKNDHYYLSIAYSRKQEDGTFEQNRIIVFEESIRKFVDKVVEAGDLIEKLHERRRKEEIIEARKTHPRAFMKWEPEEDEKLETQFKDGIDIETLAKTFGRSSGALLARLERIGLIPGENTAEV